MHDLLFEHQQKLSQVNLGLYAERCGLDLVRFFTDLESPEVAARAKADFLSGARSGVNGTPTFFINGKRLVEGGRFPPGAAQPALRPRRTPAPPPRPAEPSGDLGYTFVSAFV
jgi:protein-disulfide isomerase